MANRTMAAKRLKLRKQKRLFPKYLGASYVPTGKPPNMLVMQELKERSRGLAFDGEYADYLVTRMLMDMQGQHLHPGREEVKQHIRRIQETAPSLMNVTLVDNKICRVQMYFPSERNKFVLYEENRLEHFIRTSMVYMDRERCIAAMKSDRVRWVHFSSVHPPTINNSE